MSTEISKTEAAVIFTAALAYLTKPKPAQPEVSVSLGKEEAGMLAGFGKDLRELKTVLASLDKRMGEVERGIRELRLRVEHLERKSAAAISAEAKPAGFRLWSYAGRHELGGERAVVKNLYKQSFWKVVNMFGEKSVYSGRRAWKHGSDS